MPAWMHIDDDSTGDRYAAALALITEGRAVAFPGFSLCVYDGSLRIDLNFSGTEPDDRTAADQVAFALKDFEFLLATKPGYRLGLSGYPRRIALVSSSGNVDVELGQVVAGEVVWRHSFQVHCMSPPTTTTLSRDLSLRDSQSCWQREVPKPSRRI